jgi:hypothetical protein
MNEFESRERPTKEQRAAKKELARIDGEKNLATLRKKDNAFRANFERLKTERKAREQLGKPGGTASVT